MEALLLLKDVEDQKTHMCPHGLKDPVNGRPNMKPTLLRATFRLLCSILLCGGGHVHQHLQGRLPSGVLRTEVAQTYTDLFAKRAAKDCHVRLLAKKKQSKKVYTLEGTAREETCVVTKQSIDTENDMPSSIEELLCGACDEGPNGLLDLKPPPGLEEPEPQGILAATLSTFKDKQQFSHKKPRLAMHTPPDSDASKYTGRRITVGKFVAGGKEICLLDNWKIGGAATSMSEPWSGSTYHELEVGGSSVLFQQGEDIFVYAGGELGGADDDSSSSSSSDSDAAPAPAAG
jgi:hypothetical protein